MVRRVRKAIRALEVSFTLVRARIERLSKPELVPHAIKHELRRTNLKTRPIGNFTIVGNCEFEPTKDWEIFYDIQDSLPTSYISSNSLQPRTLKPPMCRHLPSLGQVRSGEERS